MILRGGEVGVTNGKTCLSATGVVIADLDWSSPFEETNGFFAVVADVVPIKEERVTRSRVPGERELIFRLANEFGVLGRWVGGVNT